MQIGPRIRVGGSVGHLGEKLKRLVPSPAGMLAGRNPVLGAVAYHNSPGADPLRDLGTGARNFAILAGLGYAGVGPMAAEASEAVPGAVAADAADVGGTATAAGTAGTAGTVGTQGTNAAAQAARGGLSLADKLAIGGTVVQGIGGIASGIAQGQQQQLAQDAYRQYSPLRQAAIDALKGSVGGGAPTPFQAQSPFAGMPSASTAQMPQAQPMPLAPQGGPPGLNDPRAQWTAILRARGLAGLQPMRG